MGVWTAEREQEALALWRVGKTGGQIAELFGLSRCAIMGKLYRLGILGDLPTPEKRRRLRVGAQKAAESHRQRWAKYTRAERIEIAREMRAGRARRRSVGL